MKAALTLVALALGFVLSLWAASRLIREHSDENADQRLLRHDKWMRNFAAALGCGLTAIIVGVVWLQDTAKDAENATEVALMAARRNCLNQQEAHAATEKGLIADVRLATAQYQASVDAVLQLDERALVALPDPTALPPEVQVYVEALIEQSDTRAENDRERFTAAVTRWETELATRQAALDEARSRRINACVDPETGELPPDDTTVPTTTT